MERPSVVGDIGCWAERTEVHEAASLGHASRLRRLIAAGASVSSVATPLHYAARAQQAEMVELLVEFGANIYARDRHERRPVDYTPPGSPTAALLRDFE
ncbi:hypothetical protein CRUP_030406, partial [Coryphaenoides rupestris]